MGHAEVGRADEAAKMEQMRQWLDALCKEMELEPAVVREPEAPLLELISTVAHGPSRPGAPVTAFVVGYVAAASGRPVTEVVAQARQLAESWPRA